MSTADIVTMLGHLSIIAIVGAACFYAGWKAASAYLPAARAVSDVSNAAVAQANNFATTMEKQSLALDAVRGEMALLRDATEGSTKATTEHRVATEGALLTLFEGLERAGLARSSRTAPRQHGDAAASD